MTNRTTGALLAVMLGGVVGCGGKDVSSASCSACVGGGFSESDCERFAALSGCESWALLDTAPGCINQCRFESCDEPPMCSEPEPVDAGGVDAPPDPRCDGEDGLFPTCDLCPDTCGMVMFMGVTQYTCPCGSCPCGFVCGSIPLPGGGTISSVCAPP